MFLLVQIEWMDVSPAWCIVSLYTPLAVMMASLSSDECGAVSVLLGSAVVVVVSL